MNLQTVIVFETTSHITGNFTIRPLLRPLVLDSLYHYYHYMFVLYLLSSLDCLLQPAAGMITRIS